MSKHIFMVSCFENITFSGHLLSGGWLTLQGEVLTYGE
jgi:hypothetical protein